MKKLLLVMLFLLSSLTLFAVRYVVDAKDGYANVRNEAAVNLDSIAELKNGTLITKFKEKGEWYYIEFEREDGTPFDYGYIHKSQLKKYVKTK